MIWSIHFNVFIFFLSFSSEPLCFVDVLSSLGICPSPVSKSNWKIVHFLLFRSIEMASYLSLELVSHPFCHFPWSPGVSAGSSIRNASFEVPSRSSLCSFSFVFRSFGSCLFAALFDFVSTIYPAHFVYRAFNCFATLFSLYRRKIILEIELHGILQQPVLRHIHPTHIHAGASAHNRK